MNWEKIKIFYQVARAGSITNASKCMNINQSSLSRSVAHLEHELKLKLFHRIPHGIELTQQGKMLFKVAQKMAFEAEAVETIFAEDIGKAEAPCGW